MAVGTRVCAGNDLTGRRLLRDMLFRRTFIYVDSFVLKYRITYAVFGGYALCTFSPEVADTARDAGR